MNGLKTFARSFTLEAINAALRNAQVSRVPEIVVLDVDFLAADTAYAFEHSLGKVPQFATFLPEVTGVAAYATEADRMQRTDTTVVLRASDVTGGLLKLEAK